MLLAHENEACFLDVAICAGSTQLSLVQHQIYLLRTHLLDAENRCKWLRTIRRWIDFWRCADASCTATDRAANAYVTAVVTWIRVESRRTQYPWIVLRFVIWLQRDKSQKASCFLPKKFEIRHPENMAVGLVIARRLGHHNQRSVCCIDSTMRTS